MKISASKSKNVISPATFSFTSSSYKYSFVVVPVDGYHLHHLSRCHKGQIFLTLTQVQLLNFLYLKHQLQPQSQYRHFVLLLMPFFRCFNATVQNSYFGTAGSQCIDKIFKPGGVINCHFI